MGCPARVPATCCSFRARAARICLASSPTGTYWPAMRACCPRSPPPSSGSHPGPLSSWWPRWTDRTRNSISKATPTSACSGCIATLNPGEEPDLLTEAVRTLELPSGEGQAFVHGEASSVRALRRHLLVERGLPAVTLSVSGYWKLRRTEEGWREDKAEWQELVAADSV